MRAQPVRGPGGNALLCHVTALLLSAPPPSPRSRDRHTAPQRRHTRRRYRRREEGCGCVRQTDGLRRRIYARYGHGSVLTIYPGAINEVPERIERRAKPAIGQGSPKKKLK